MACSVAFVNCLAAFLGSCKYRGKYGSMGMGLPYLMQQHQTSMLLIQHDNTYLTITTLLYFDFSGYTIPTGKIGAGLLSPSSWLIFAYSKAAYEMSINKKCPIQIENMLTKLVPSLNVPNLGRVWLVPSGNTATASPNFNTSKVEA